MYSVITTHCSDPATGDQLVHLFRGCGALRCCASNSFTVRIPTSSPPSTASGDIVFTSTSSQPPPCFLDKTSSPTQDPVLSDKSTDDKYSSYSTNTTSFSTDFQQEGTTAHSVHMLTAVTWPGHVIIHAQFSVHSEYIAILTLYVTRGKRSCDTRISSN